MIGRPTHGSSNIHGGGLWGLRARGLPVVERWAVTVSRVFVDRGGWIEGCLDLVTAAVKGRWASSKR